MRAYISAKLQDEMWIRRLRDDLYSLTGARLYYRKVNPHITVIPPFTFDGQKENEVRELVNDCPLKGRDVNVNGLSVWKNIDEPFVVMLDVDVEMQDVRDRMMTKLRNGLSANVSEPVDPHVTLFKTTGDWDDVSSDIKDSIEREIERRKTFKDTEIKKVELELKD